jgi:hypothetical protein
MDDWRLVHLGKFAVGGAAIVMSQATPLPYRTSAI